MNRKKNLETSLVIVTGLLIIYLIYELHVLLIIAAIIGMIGVLFNKISAGITWIWNKIADILGAVMSRVILSIFFYLFLFPIALFSRLFSKDKLNLKLKNKNTLWIERDYEFTATDIEKSW